VASFHNLHYHNDLIEMGVYLGVLGIAAYILLLWGWFQSFRVCGLDVLGATLISFIFLAGLSDEILIYGQIPSLLLVITAIAIVWQREHGNLAREADRLRKSPERNISEFR
jgi:O-antigen ligase